MDYDYLDDDDIGIKLLDNGDYPHLDEHLYQLPYIFKRSEIEPEIRTTLPQTLFLRNKLRKQDYMIQFKKTDNLGTFLKLFPHRIYDDRKTAGYYFMIPWSSKKKHK